MKNKIRYGKMVSTALLCFIAVYVVIRIPIGAFVPEADYASLDELVKWFGGAEGGLLALLKYAERKKKDEV